MADGGSQVSLTVKWEATDKQGVEAIKIHMVMELNTSLLTHVLAWYGNRWLHVDIFIDIFIYMGWFTHIYFLALLAEKIWKQ